MQMRALEVLLAAAMLMLNACVSTPSQPAASPTSMRPTSDFVADFMQGLEDENAGDTSWVDQYRPVYPFLENPPVLQSTPAPQSRKLSSQSHKFAKSK